MTGKRENKEDLGLYSSHSVVCGMNNFVKAVNNMDDTILVPSRLIDMRMVEDKKRRIPRSLFESDLFSFYTMLKTVRNELLWGPKDNDVPEDFNSGSDIATKSGGKKGHFRRQSTLSMVSVSSQASASDTESDCCEADTEDSGLETEEREGVDRLREDFSKHLTGLRKCLKQMTDGAHYLTSCYQDEVGIFS